MAVSWTPFSDGESLLTLRNSINTFNDSVESNITTIESDITSLETGKVSLSSSGIVYVTSSSGIASASVTTSYANIKMVDTTSINVANGHISVNNTTATYTINTTGKYKVYFSGAMTADNGEEVTFNYNVAGSSYIANPPSFTGAGTKAIPIYHFTIMQLTAGSAMYIEAKSDSASTTVQPLNCGLSIEKLPY